MSEMPLTSNPLQEKPEFRQEFRLGLVVYGGVSLAIYMNGVCREFYNAVRGRGIYKLIKALTDSDIIVDVISGTSAGGINGVLLSYALTNSTKEEVVDFENFAQVWRNSGNINDLLHQADPLKTEEKVESVLDGEGYYQKELFEAFQKASQNKTTSTGNEWFSPSNELDLFVTGTDVLGKVYKAFDNTGRIIQVKDHRTVFLLKYRKDRKHPFEPEHITQAALAKLCRITSCFPVAFPTVTVKLIKSETQATSDDDKADRNLVVWGQLDNRELPSEDLTVNGHQLYFVDGGVLDNRPFSYTIREIYYRIAYRPVSRRLFYIDPSPDRFLGSKIFNEMAKPSISQVAQDSLIGMPRYESIANDLQEIKERNEKVRRYRFLFSKIENAVVDSGPHSASSKSSEETSSKEKSSENTYLLTRLVGLRDRVLPLILQMDQITHTSNGVDTSNFKKQKLLEKAAQLLTQYVSDQPERKARADMLNQLGEQIRDLDVEYALRKHFFILGKVCQLMSDRPNETTSQEYSALKDLAGKLGLQIELLEVVKAALEEMLKLKSVSDGFYNLLNQKAETKNALRKQIYDYLLNLHRFLLNVVGLEAIDADFWNNLPNEQISSALKQLRKKYAQLKDKNFLDSIQADHKYRWEDDSENASDHYFSILRKVEQGTEALIKDSKLSEKNDLPSKLSEKNDLLNKFYKFSEIDCALYPYEYLADIHEKELIEIYRISPDDAQHGFGDGKGLNDKLAGDQLRAFGGFFKKSWRSNDILWGRLDGLDRLVDALITPESLKRFSGFLKREEARIGSAFEQETYIRDLVKDTLPSAASEEEKSIVDYLMKLAKQDSELNESERKDFLNKLVLAGQRAIINSDLENVITDAIDEQLQWNQQQVQPNKNLQTMLQKLNYKPVAIPSSPSLEQINLLLSYLLMSDATTKVKAFLQRQALDSLLGESFPKLTPSDRQRLSEYPLKVAETAQTSLEDLYEFLNRLLIATKRELFQPKLTGSALKAMETFSQQLEQIWAQLKPKYEPVSGYFDRAVNTFTATELARTSVVSLFAQGKQEDYFRNLYRIGSEKLTDDIPSTVLNRLAARTGLILRNILLSSGAGDRIRRSPVYPFINTPLQLYYWWGYRQSSKSIFLVWLRLFLILAAVGSIAFILFHLPIPLLTAVIALILLWLSNLLRR